VFLIDHPANTYDAAAEFWVAARGGARRSSGASLDEDPYESLDRLGGGILLELQRTGLGTPPRVHLDIETDDVAAEVARLQAAGAAVLEQREGYVIMADPGAMPFCVVPVQSGDAFAEHATAWD
jgi:hypothetical protein